MNKIKVEKYFLKTNKNLNKRICLISDIHHDYDFNKKIYDNLLIKIKELKPDYITISGDVIDKGYILEDINCKNMIENFIKHLGNIAKTIIVMGNHDQRYSYIKYNKEYTLNWFNSLNRFNNVYFLNNNSITFDKILQIADILGVSVVDIITYPVHYVPESEVVFCDKCKEKDEIISHLNSYISVEFVKIFPLINCCIVTAYRTTALYCTAYYFDIITCTAIGCLL